MIKKLFGGGIGALILLGVGIPVYGLSLSEEAIKADTVSLERSITSVKPPKVEQPQWLAAQIAKERAAAVAAQQSLARSPQVGTIVVNYSVSNRGVSSANLDEFRRLSNESLNSPLGWARLNIVFKEVQSGGQFTLILAEASQLPTFSSGCSAEYSCRVGSSVIINQSRWNGATPSWNNSGGSLRDYRHMVINHEVGHWLGHGHQNCPAAGKPAPIMQQQSMDLQGCTFNPWPLKNELRSSTLGL